MERRLKKLKLDRLGKVELSYQARRDDSAPWDDYTMSCNAPPRPEMALSLQHGPGSWGRDWCFAATVELATL